MREIIIKRILRHLRRATLSVVLVRSLLWLFRVLMNKFRTRTVEYSKPNHALKIPDSARNYSPPIVPSGLLQTMAGPMVSRRGRRAVSYTREEFRLERNEKLGIGMPGLVSLDWLVKDPDGTCGDGRDDGPVIIIIPGLTGCSTDYYVQSMVLHLKAWPGASIAAYNPRSRGGNVLENAYLYSAGYTSDLRAVIGRIRARVGERAILAIAYSLGASVLGRLLGEDAEGSDLSAAVLCAPPLDPLLMSNHLETTVQGKLCDRFLVRSCNKMLLEHAPLRNLLGSNPGDELLPRSMMQLDHRFIAPMFGFACASHYYRSSSAGALLHRIRRPTLFVAAENDPICPAALLRKDDFLVNELIALIVTKEGGHSLDFGSGISMQPWFPRVAADFLRLNYKRN